MAAADVALTGADLVAGGTQAAYALCRPPGHHAGPGYYGGFCLLNNAAIAARALAGLGRVAVVDVDFHHGNGTQDIFWEDPEVLYVSLHGDPAGGHYPHFTGAADEAGGGPGRGATRNLPLPDGTGDDAYLDALAEAMALVAAFRPATLVVSAGFDTFAGDPLGAFAVTTDGFRRIGPPWPPPAGRPCWSRRAATPSRPWGPTRSPCWTGSAAAPDRPYRSTRSFARYVLTSASWASRLALPRLGLQGAQGRPRRRPAGASGFESPPLTRFTAQTDQSPSTWRSPGPT